MTQTTGTGSAFNTEKVGFRSEEEICDACLYRPSVPAPYPCLIMAHGFAAIREMRLDAFAERFAAAGLAVLVFDFRHLGRSEGHPRGLVDIRRQHEDYRSAIAYARTVEGVDPERIALWGTSFSGAHTLAIAAEDHRVAAAVMQNPHVDGPSTWLAGIRSLGVRNTLTMFAAVGRDQLRAMSGGEPYRLPIVGPPGSAAVFTTPDAEPGYYALLPPDPPWDNTVPARILPRVLAYRLLGKARKVRCPLMVCVCDHDVVTPARPAVRVAHRAPRGELKRYAIGHFDLYDGEVFQRVTEDQIDFFRRHLLDAGARPTDHREAVAP